MKKIYTILAFALLAITANAQVTLNMESGNRSTDAGLCWGFGAVSYTNTTALKITDAWSGRSNSLTNPSPTACWIKSPWLKPGSGNITFNVKLENTSGTSKAVRIRFITYNSSNTSTGEGSIVADSFQYDFPTPFSSTLRNISYTLPTSVASSSNPYKVMISFVGVGGNNRVIIDDIVIPGTYFADPANNCLPITTIADADGDSVADADDAYPADKYRAFNNYLISSAFSTLMFEDLWPSRGDYDFNDLVVDYNVNTITNKDQQVVEMKIKVVARASGASFKDGFAIQLNDLPANKILSVSGYNNNGNLFTLAANGTETGQTYANILIFGDIYKVLQYPGGTGGINTNPSAPKASYDTLTVLVKFQDGNTVASGGVTNISAINLNNFNPYMIVNQERGREVHLPNKVPTTKANLSLLGTDNDNSDANSGRYYKTANNLPWAISIATSIPYAIEKAEFSTAFTNFISWAESNGTAYTDWYENKQGYRNTANIYNQ